MATAKKQILVFLVVGVLTVLIDFVTYQILLTLFSAPASPAKGISFLVGTLFAYFANKTWTFQQPQPTMSTFPKFIALYLATLAVNVLINKLFLFALQDFSQKISVAFLFATGTSATLNFLGMKYFVFSHSPAKESQ